MVKRAVREADDATNRLRVARERHRDTGNVCDEDEGEVDEALADLKIALSALR